MKRRVYLAAYDIADGRRLRRVARCLTKVGIRLQYSLFYLPLTVVERVGLLAELEALIDPSEDDVRLYPLPKQGQVTWLGRSPFPDDVMLFEGAEDLLRFGVKTPLPSQEKGE